MRKIPILILSLILAACTSKTELESLQKVDLWTAGSGAYNNYRIPSVIVSPSGTVLAFCEGREGGDNGDINLLLKRSEDNGITWNKEQIIWDDLNNSCGNPCPVVDEETGRIWLFLTWNNGEDHESKIIRKTSKYPRLPYSCFSDDDGLTWSVPEDMSSTCRDTSWGWYATGPGFGIQAKTGKYRGRLIIPSNHSYDDPEGTMGNGPFSYGSHVLYSDDHGENWTMSQSITPGCNESQITELSDGTLLMNMRSYNGPKSRATSISKDGGATWSEIFHDCQLVESRCQASILNFGDFRGQSMQLFTNPAVPEGRTHLTLKASFDDCESWTNSKLIYAGPAAYSCLTRLSNGKIGIFFEAGKEHAYEKMIFVAIDADQIFRESELIGLADL
jgi:sialidase-1